MRTELSKLEQISRSAWNLTVRMIAEDDGQDLIEYALLAAFIGLAGWAILQSMPATMRTTYESWVRDCQWPDCTSVPALWDPPEPSSGGS